MRLILTRLSTVVSRAFQILSDADKKAAFDRYGTDPDSRFSAASASSPFSGFASRRGGARAGGPMFEEEISPEDLFRQFFGGGMGGGPFGPFGGGMGGGFGGPGFMFNMGGGPGIRVHQFGGGHPRRRPHNHQDAPRNHSPLEALRSLLPLLLLFVIPLLSSFFGGGSSSYTGPTLRFDAALPPHTLGRTSNRLHVPYWVNPADVSDYTDRKWKDLDKLAEGHYVGTLNTECEIEQNTRTRLINEAHGFFFTDQAKLDQARRMDMSSCKKLQELTGHRVWA